MDDLIKELVAAPLHITPKPKVDEKNSEKWISEIVGALFDPIVVFPGGWADTIPQWLKEAITLQRLIENMRALNEGDLTATDAEACAYLYTACLCQMPSHDWSQIYLYTATKVYEAFRTKESGVTMPEDVRVDSLNRNQLDDLQRLKRWIYDQRANARHEKERGLRREKREEEAERKAQEQPALFEL